MATMTVEEMAHPIYRVGSASSDRTYTVDVEMSTCTCTNWSIQRNREVGKLQAQGKPTDQYRYACKHVREVQSQYGGGSPTPTKKPVPKRDTKVEAQKKADAIVSKFTAAHTKKRALETLRDAAKLKKQ